MAPTKESVKRTTKMDLLAIAKEIGPQFKARAEANDADGRFAAENFEMMREKKLFSARIPVELGGGGATHTEIAALIRELAHYDGSTALAFSMHSHLLATLIWRVNKGLTPSSEPALRKIAAEELVLVSTGGSDWLDGSGTLTKVEDGFKYSGRKVFSSGSPAGHLLVTTGVYDDPDQGAQVLHFAVPMSSPGVTVTDDWNSMGMRATGSNSLIVEDVFVAEAGVTLRRPKGQWVPFFDVISPLAWSLVMSAYVGVAEAARETAIEQVAKKRDDRTVQEAVGEMDTDLLSAQTSLQSIVDLASSDYVPNADNSNLIYRHKTIITKAAIRSVEKAIEAVGGAAYFRKLGLERNFRDIQAAKFHAFQERKQYSFSGRIALGLDPVE
ncbi:MAG: acyl-CoA/acyl-ACP dehydrogenase [Chloroflexi bacterium]|nr:acyl-CoA/acyl-ACP dehydrogenase [Chloroflexota bacterium]